MSKDTTRLIIKDVNKWDQIFDFTKDESGKRPNFALVDPSEYKIVEKTIDGIDS